jgi:shikimate kinase
MTGRAACRGAATIVNAIPTGLGAAFGITLEADAEVSLTETGGFSYRGAPEGAELVEGCVNSVLERAGIGRRGVSVRVESDIPPSRGLKSSSAVSNAVVLATARAADVELNDDEVLGLAITESLRAGVTVTGAFDDAAACLFGGAVVTDNRQRKILSRGKLGDSLSVVVHVPERRIEKCAVKALDFSPARGESEEAIRLALAGEYAKAIELNSRACARVLGLSEEVAEFARAKGALAAGISGTGPATVALVGKDLAKELARSMECEFEGDVLVAQVNEAHAREVVPRLL